MAETLLADTIDVGEMDAAEASAILNTDEAKEKGWVDFA